MTYGAAYNSIALLRRVNHIMKLAVCRLYGDGMPWHTTAMDMCAFFYRVTWVARHVTRDVMKVKPCAGLRAELRRPNGTDSAATCWMQKLTVYTLSYQKSKHKTFGKKDIQNL
jgi:hypothetical protein